MSVGTGSTALFRVASRKPDAVDCGSLTCEIGGVVTGSKVVMSILFVGLVTLVALTYVQNASRTCQREQRRVLDERDAFVEFADRVESLEPVSAESSAAFASGSSPGLNRTIGFGNTADVTLRRVLSIYRDTVMSVPHYEADYDETVAESISTELGSDTAISLATNGTLSQPAQHALVEHSREAAEARDSLADAIETEIDALSDIDTELTAIDRRRRQLVEHLTEVNINKIGAAIDIWKQLDDLEAETQTVATERQQSLQEPPMRMDPAISDGDEMTFYDYLYGNTEGPRHPVLTQITDLISSIRKDRDHAASWIIEGR